MSKRLLLLLTFGFLFCGAAKAQYVTISDSTFRNMLISKYPTCFNAALQMDTTCNAVTNEVSLTIEPPYSYYLQNIDAIKYFKNLRVFEYRFSVSLTALPMLPDSLEEITLAQLEVLNSMANMPKNLKKFTSYLTPLTTLPAAFQFTKLKDFSCNNSLLTSLPPLPSTLEHLNVSDGKLTSLPRLDTLPQLTRLFCNNNKLNTIPALRTDTLFGTLGYDIVDVSGNLLTSFPAFNGIGILDISYNKFTTWPTFRPNSIRDLTCGNNPINYLPPLANGGPERLSCRNLNLTSIPPLPSYLKSLDCSSNPITALTNLPTGLVELYCIRTTISNLSGLPVGLKSLYCDSNNISTLPVLPGSLNRLSMRGTQVNCLPKLPTSLQHLYINSLQILCLPNSGNNLVVYDSNGRIINLPFCNSTNNANACQSFPVIQGKVFYDLNSNGTRDAGEYYKKNYKVGLSNGAFTFTNDSGFYQISPDTLNNVSFVVNPPALFNALPPGRTFNFTTSDTLVVQNIALQPTIIKDSITVHMTPYTRARPGFELVYGIKYENVGTTNLSGTNFLMQYDTTLLVFKNASNAGIVLAGNTLSLNSSTVIPVGDFNGFSSSFVIKNTAPLGNVLLSNCSVVSGNASSSDTSSLILVGSFDPNDKTATPKLTIAQLAAGSYVDYIIRFQNTGTDTAIHVVVADTLSSKLQANTLQLIATSHLCKTTVKDKVVIFEMRDIMLPDSNVNEFASHGFLRFRVKPVNGLVVGDIIKNTAAIYFDYNLPVYTNTEMTTIVTDILPLKLLSFTVKKEGKANQLQWTSANEINVDRFEIEHSSNGRDFSTIGKVKATSANNYSYTDNNPTTQQTTPNTKLQTNYYRLRMIDKDGQFTFSPVRMLNNNGAFSVSIYPNPAKDNLQVQIDSDKKTTLQMQVLSLDGKVILSNTTTANAGSILHIININALSKGSYVLKVTTTEKDEQVVKFEKL